MTGLVAAVPFRKASRSRQANPVHAFGVPESLPYYRDYMINERRALYTTTSHVYVLAETDHVTIGQHHSWDIARRIRGAEQPNRMSRRF